MGVQSHSVIVLALLLVLSGCKGQDRPSEDAGEDEVEDVLEDEGGDEPEEDPPVDGDPEPADDPEDEDASGDAEEETDAPDADDDAGEDASEDVTEEDVTEEDVEEEPFLIGCGNGVLEPLLGEVCDDGNAVRETCRTTDPTACLEDCSAFMASCPSGAVNPGEQCDDGNTETMDVCTTSCTLNIQSIGSPCQCTSGCDVLDFTAGTIVGCDFAIRHADSTRTLACVRSSRDSTRAIDVYAASGFCTLLAIDCTGTFCHMVPTTGDVDLFTCPSGSAALTEVRILMGMIITAMSCHPLCWTDADCRWNAVEDGSSPWSGRCGGYECLPVGEGGQSICVDPRNSL